MDATSYHDIKSSLRQLYLDAPRHWLVGFSGGKDSTMLASLILQKPNPWGGDNRPLCKLYANASNGDCPIQIDTSTPSCGNSRFGCWTCTVVDRDKASEGLLAAGDERMEHLIQFCDTLLEFHEPANGWRDGPRGNCSGRPSPLVTSVHRKPHKGSNQAGDKVWLRFK